MRKPEAGAAPGWRVAITLDEGAEGAWGTELGARGFVPVACVILREAPPADPAALDAAARALDEYDWIACASARAVRALRRAREGPWPPGVRCAAVGPATARALAEAGADAARVVVGSEGAEALWGVLERLDQWRGRRVLVPTVPGGLRTLAIHLVAAGGRVDEVEAYRMAPRDAAAIAEDWRAARPDALVVGSSPG